MNNDALKTCQEKKTYLEKALAISSDYAQKFTLLKQIEECDEEIARLKKSATTEIDNNKVLSEALAQFAKMPIDIIPSVDALPEHSRMPLSPNLNFVGREHDLKAIAQAFKAGATASISQAATVTGMGGLGKTQLACEFVHKYGQYFLGGVFWLSFADAKVIEGEISLCGGADGLNLYADAEQLSLKEQVSRVKAAWCEPIPRLLVFDNCEDPQLLTQWKPAFRGCHVLVTSRSGE